MIRPKQRSRRRVAGWLAIGAMLAHIALPGVANLGAQSTSPGSITLCTAYGLRTVSVPAQDLPASDAPAPAHEQHCTHCCACGVLAAGFARAMPTCDSAGHMPALGAVTPDFAADNFNIPHARPPPGHEMS
jgi:hypothetical protein